VAHRPRAVRAGVRSGSWRCTPRFGIFEAIEFKDFVTDADSKHIMQTDCTSHMDDFTWTVVIQNIGDVGFAKLWLRIIPEEVGFGSSGLVERLQNKVQVVRARS